MFRSIVVHSSVIQPEPAFRRHALDAQPRQRIVRTDAQLPALGVGFRHPVVRPDGAVFLRAAQQAQPRVQGMGDLLPGQPPGGVPGQSAGHSKQRGDQHQHVNQQDRQHVAGVLPQVMHRSFPPACSPRRIRI